MESSKYNNEAISVIEFNSLIIKSWDGPKHLHNLFLTMLETNVDLLMKMG